MTDIISNLMKFIIKLFSNLLPAPDTEAAEIVVSSFAEIKQLLQAVNMLIPLDTCFSIMLLSAAFSILYFTIFIINWIIKRVRGG